MKQPEQMNGDILLAVVGSRDGITQQQVWNELEKRAHRIRMIISGGARGVDSYAAEWAKANGKPLYIHPAQWDLHGKAAGFMRNTLIAEQCHELLCFWNGESRGCIDTVKKAEKLGKLVEVIQND